MTQKDLNDLCTVISIYTQCNSLFETLEQDKRDIPEELMSDFDCFYYDLKCFILTIGNYSEDKKEDIFISVCDDITKQEEQNGTNHDKNK
jgi:hypothetical protein